GELHEMEVGRVACGAERSAAGQPRGEHHAAEPRDPEEFTPVESFHADLLVGGVRGGDAARAADIPGINARTRTSTIGTPFSMGGACTTIRGQRVSSRWCSCPWTR